MKPVLMIHEVTDWMFDLPLEDYTLTFDDGLYTQYLYLDKIKEINTEKIFFISTGIVADEKAYQCKNFINCYNAHEYFLNTGDAKHYMNWSQIKDIHKTDKCMIGGHSHNHNHIDIKNIIKDTRLMMTAFHKQNIAPIDFCFPFNEEHNIYKAHLRNTGFRNFYGNDRVDIDELY